MRRLANFFSHIASCAASKPRTCALLLNVLAWAWIVWSGFPLLQNDDIQIEFLLLDGGEGNPSFSVYTHGWLAALIHWGTSVYSGFSWYFAVQLILFLAAGYYAALFVTSTLLPQLRQKGAFGAVAIPTACLFVFYWLTHLLRLIQYTSVAIFAVCTACVALFFWVRRPSAGHALAALFLFGGGIALRFSAVIPGIAVGIGLAVLVGQTCGKSILLRYSAGWSIFAIVASLFAFTHHSAYNEHPEWRETSSFLQARVGLVDYPDNSRLDKTEDYRRLGFSPNDVTMFRHFIYAPLWDSEPLAQRALSVHRAGNHGLFGSETAAAHGILAINWSHLAQMGNTAIRLTPWIPLTYVLLAPLLFLGRLPTRKQMCILLPLIALILAIVISGRPVERVYEPILGLSTLIAAALMPVHRDGCQMNRLATILLISLSLICLLFVFRHYRHGRVLYSYAPATYCAQRPEQLFFSVTLQNISELYPASLFSSAGKAWREGNIIPLADGWMFYSPTYRHFLKKHIKEEGGDPYASLLTEKARLVSYVPQESDSLFNCLKAYLRERYGCDVTFTEEALIPPCRFWRILPSSPAAPDSPAS